MIPVQKNDDHNSYTGMQVYLIVDSGEMKSLWLPEPPQGKYYLSIEEKIFGKSDIFVEAKDNRWLLCCNFPAQILDNTGKEMDYVILSNQSKCYIRLKEKECVLYAERINSSSMVFHNYQIQNDCDINIGRSKDNDLIYLNNTVSGHHAVLQVRDEEIIVRDKGSLNGVFVNGKRVCEQSLHLGDIIFIMGLKIVIGVDFISVNDGNERVQVLLKKLSPYTRSKFPLTIDRVSTEKEDLLFNRLPRKKRRYEPDTISIEAPPFSLNMNQLPMILRMGSSAVMGGSALMRGNYSSVLSILLFPLMNHLYTDKDKKEYEKLRSEKYSEYLLNKKKEIRNEKLKEESILNENYPPLNVIITYPAGQKRLWERGNREEDFLSIRIGNGHLPLMAAIHYPDQKFELEDDPLEQKMYLLAKEKVLLDNVPIMLPLIENYLCGVVGGKREKAALLIRMIIQIVFLHSYDEVKIVLLIDDEIKRKIASIRYLPHIWNDERNFRFLATDLSAGYLIGEYLSKQLEVDVVKPRDLKEILKDRPYYVVFAWNKQIFDSIEILKRVTKTENNPGVSVITFFDEVLQTSHEIIHLHSNTPNEITYLKETGYGGQEFILDDLNYKLANEMIQVVSNTKLKMIQASYALPTMVTFLELFGVGKVEHLNPLKRWKENNPVNSLAVPIGVSSDGSPFEMDLHQKYQGPHGLVAGMTGSGKSEFIITLILSLALNFHPDEVAFVLIDYKGGGLAGAFEDKERNIHLPHLVGTITNLDGSEIQRALMSIESELKRRQWIFNEAKSSSNEGTMDIYTYQKLYRNGKVKVALPHLFIISDEFAELKSQEPEFMEQLISTARIGRSLGIHLILATQKPSGVVNDQINSNAKFRVCLKVQTRADSDEMLRRPEAAELKDTGRFYLQVGYNEYFALGQSAWCGAPYEPQEEAIVHRDDSVQIIDDVGQSIAHVKPAAKKINSGVSQLVAIVQYLSDIAKREKIVSSRLWLDPLQTDISIQNLYKKWTLKRKDSISIYLGMIDDPENQNQYPYKLDLQKCKNFLVVGGNQSGKTTLLQTILYAAICNYSPEDINYYILDYSSNLLKIFDGTRYCGGAWGEGEEQQVEKFFQLLNDIISERKEDFLEAEVNSFEAYREIKKIPLILIIIDNITGLSSWKRGQSIYYDLNLLIREANSVGIKFLISAGSLDDILYKIKKEFGTRFVLDAKNRFEYGDILGVDCRFEPLRVPGRGLLREEDRPLECQIARYGNGEMEQRRIQNLKDEIKQISKNYCAAKQARLIPQIPETESYEEFCRDILPKRIPLGYSLSDMRKISMPLKQLYCMSVYFGNERTVSEIMANYLYAALRDKMHLWIVKRIQSSIFNNGILQTVLQDEASITFFHCTKEDTTALWKKLYTLIYERKNIRNEYCDMHNIPKTGNETMRLCFDYIQSRTYPVLILFESFLDFCNIADEETKKVMEKIFSDGRGFNYYFLGCYYPDDASTLVVNSMHDAFNKEEFTLLYGGQFHRQGLLSLPAEYRSITNPSKKINSCIMQYHSEQYPLWMPCGLLETQMQDPDEADIIF